MVIDENQQANNKRYGKGRLGVNCPCFIAARQFSPTGRVVHIN